VTIDLDLDKSPTADFDSLRDYLRGEFAKLNDRLNTIERKLDMIPDLRFLDRDEVAQKVVRALREAEANPPWPLERIPVPQR
jgi:hypothetical protein